MSISSASGCCSAWAVRDESIDGIPKTGPVFGVIIGFEEKDSPARRFSGSGVELEAGTGVCERERERSGLCFAVSMRRIVGGCCNCRMKKERDAACDENINSWRGKYMEYTQRRIQG